MPEVMRIFRRQQLRAEFFAESAMAIPQVFERLPGGFDEVANLDHFLLEFGRAFQAEEPTLRNRDMTSSFEDGTFRRQEISGAQWDCAAGNRAISEAR